MISRVLVLGGGSAGFLTAITIKNRLPHLDVTVLRSREIGIIGVGEATTIGVPQHLHFYLGLDPGEFYRLAEPQWKLGIRFLWGKRPYFDFVFGHSLDTKYQLLPKGTGYFCPEGPTDFVSITSGLMTLNNAFLRGPDGRPQLGPEVAYHIENVKFVHYLEVVAARLGIAVREDKVVEVRQDEHGIRALQLESGSSLNADLFVDCSGFASVLLGKALQEPFRSFASSLYCDRAVVGSWDRTDEPIKPYTTAETMQCGWCWQIDHEHHINRGYVHSSAYLSDGEAEAEFRAANPRLGETRIVRYVSGRHERSWVKNVVAIGNSSGFVEPLESTGLAALCTQSQAVAEMLFDTDQDPGPAMIGQYNKRFALHWDAIRQFLAIHYKFNERLDTPFWRACRADANLAGAEEFVEYYRENGPSVVYRNTLLPPQDQFGMEGYLSMLVGQQVPYRKKYVPDATAQQNWERIRQAVKNKVSQAFTVREALDFIRSPLWTWPGREFFNPRP
ncbi:MAG TPA: tryptophan halogenase family protein [Gemmataceae bacterium]|nr:tryptophan halogenase family protein [Gemmataceae bacterium]